jgi:EmrB/QacA subfamily drug resistance transporter
VNSDGSAISADTVKDPPAQPVPAGTVPAAPRGVSRRSALVLLVSCLGIFVVYLDTTIVNIAFPTITRDFAAPSGLSAWILNSYSLVFAAMLIPAGSLADRYGRKRIYLVGLAGFAVMSALCGGAPDVWALIAARALQAVFGALVLPASLAVMLPEIPPARRQVAVGTWGAMGAAAAAVAPTVGALLTQFASWRWIFLVNVPICALVITLAVRFTAESRGGQGQRIQDQGIPDPIGGAMIALIPGALSLAIIEGPNWGWASGWVIAGFALAAMLLPVFLWRCRAASVPVLDLGLFRVSRFSAANAASFLFAVAFYAMLLGNVIFLQEIWHYSVLRSALANAPGPLVVLVAARHVTKISAKVGYRRVLTAGALLWVAVCVLFAVCTSATPHFLADWLVPTLLLGLSTALTIPVQLATVAQSLPPGRFAIGSAINSSFRQLGAVLGVSVLVAVTGRAAGASALSAFHHVWWAFGVIGLSAGAVVYVLPTGVLTGDSTDARAAGQR